jgi:hypothetical protein
LKPYLLMKSKKLPRNVSGKAVRYLLTHSSYLKLKENYTHKYQNYYESNNEVFLKWLHVITGDAKTYILGTYHGLEDKFLQAYLDEFCYRFNRRFSAKQLFGRLLNACILGTYYIAPEPSA